MGAKMTEQEAIEKIQVWVKRMLIMRQVRKQLQKRFKAKAGE